MYSYTIHWTDCDCEKCTAIELPKSDFRILNEMFLVDSDGEIIPHDPE